MKDKCIYPIRQKKYIVISVVCILVALCTLVLDFTLRPYVEDLAETRFQMTPYWIYIMVVPPLSYMALGILVPAAASLGLDLRFRTGIRMAVLVIGCVLLFIYLTIPLSSFTDIFNNIPMLFSLTKTLYLHHFAQTQKITASLFGVSVFLFFNK